MEIRKCTVCGGNFEVDNNYIYINVCPECQAIDPRTRSEEDRLGELSNDINGKMYRVVYWNDSQRYSVWMYRWEIV